MSVKKLEIGFELDMWPPQLTPHVYFWMHFYYTQWQKNRQPTYRNFDFRSVDEDSMAINKMLLDSCDEGTRKRILQGYHMAAKIVYLKSLYTLFHLLYKEELLKKMMTDVELGFAYDARLTLNQDVFFMRGYSYQECITELEEALKDGVQPGLLAIKAELFEASKLLTSAAKHLDLPEPDKATLSSMSKVDLSTNLRLY